MAKYSSDGNAQADIKHYQKLLIPLNIFVCILCLVSILTLLFAPIIKVNVGKIVSAPAFSEYVKDTVSKSLDKNGESGSTSGQWTFTASQSQDDLNDNDDNANNGNAGITDEMIATISSAIIDPLLSSFGSRDISLTITAFSSLKVLTGGSEALKAEITGMVGQFADDLIEVVLSLFQDGEIVDTVVDYTMPALIRTSIETYKTNPNTPPEVVNMLNDLTEEDITALTDKLGNLRNTKTPEEFVDKIVEISPDLMLTLTGQKIEDEQKDALREEIKKMVDSQVEAVAEQYPDKTYEYNLETFICIQFSQMMDLENLDKLIQDMVNGGKAEESSKAFPMAERVEESEGGDDLTDGDDEEQKPNKIYVSFTEILGAMENTQSSLSETLRSAVNKALEDLGDELDTYAQFYSFVFVFVSLFVLMWFILLLFSFIHIFTKNKRFVMWYVKLLCWIPGIIWLALLLAGIPAITVTVASMVGGEISASMITAVLSGLSSWGTGISYICYWLLWIVSIFWAFPIKHKIRKLKKQIKRGEA